MWMHTKGFKMLERAYIQSSLLTCKILGLEACITGLLIMKSGYKQGK